MPKPLLVIHPNDLIRLKKEIRNQAGFGIYSKNDCSNLSITIREKTGDYLSESTLYRFYFSKNNHQCYKNTLDKLSRFCGCDNWDLFCSDEKQYYDPFYKDLSSKNSNNATLLRSCLFNQEFRSLEHFFNHLPDQLDEQSRRKIGLDLFECLRDNKQSNNEFYRVFSTSPFVRKLLFEELADPDFRIKDADLLYQWYLKNPINNNQTDLLQEYIFAHAMLFRYHLKRSEKNEMKKIGGMLFENNDFNTKQLNEINVFPLSRWYAYRLWYNKTIESSNEDLHEYELLEYCKKAAKSFDTQGKNIVLYNTLDVLLDLGKINLIRERVLPLFHHEIKPLKQQRESVLSLMKKIEPNGIKRLIA